MMVLLGNFRVDPEITDRCRGYAAKHTRREEPT